MPKLIDRIVSPAIAFSAAAMLLSFGLCGVTSGMRSSLGRSLTAFATWAFFGAFLLLLLSLLAGAIQAIRANPRPHARRYFLIAFATTVSCNLLSIGFCSVAKGRVNGTAGALLFLSSGIGAAISGMGVMLFPREADE